jgi:thiamine biosynthesis protein ThiS
MIQFMLNGKDCETEAGSLLPAYLESQGLNPARVAVERNKEVVPRAEHPDLVIAEGDVFEVVQFVGGG